MSPTQINILLDKYFYGKKSPFFSSGNTPGRVAVLRKTALFFVAFFAAVQVFAQNSPHNPDYDIRVLNHYSAEELNEIRANDSVKFNSIVYYYTKSFIVETIDCTDCVPKDITTFNISDFEHLRQQSDRVVRIYKKYGIKLTLLSVDELTYKLPMFNLGK